MSTAFFCLAYRTVQISGAAPSAILVPGSRRFIQLVDVGFDLHHRVVLVNLNLAMEFSGRS